MNELVQQNNQISINNDEFVKELRLKAQNFMDMVHKEPNENEIAFNKFANNSKYIPISFLEMNLDEMFFGLWETKNFTYQTIANEVVGSIEVRYFHPTFNTWITRTGAGAVQIQMVSKDKGGSGDITDIGQKITNTLTKDFPHLKAECFRNAVLSIGKAFGRDLNRQFNDQYQPILKPNDNLSQEEQSLVDQLRIEISEYPSKQHLDNDIDNLFSKYKKLGLKYKIISFNVTDLYKGLK